jgi:hypothetical protein
VGISISAFPVNYYVDSSATGANDGSSWANAFDSLHLALEVAVNADTIFVAEGTYRPTNGTDRTEYFVMPSGVVLLGGYPSGGGLPLVDEHKTILSGDIGTLNDSNDNTYHVIMCNQTNPQTEITGFFITGGNADGDGDNSKGGGIYAKTTTSRYYGVRIKNCRVYGNYAKYGGGINITQKGDIFYSVIENNRCLLSGGGLYIKDDGRAYNTIIRNNYSSGRGGGVYIGGFNQAPGLVNCLIANNESVGYGSGIDQYESYVTNCAIVNNKGSGGVYQSSSYSIMKNSVIWGNEPYQVKNLAFSKFNHCGIADPDVDFSSTSNFYIDTLNAGLTDTVNYPYFRSPADSVGNVSTPEGILNMKEADWYIDPGSVCINKGDKDLYPAAAPAYDLLGNPRIILDTIDVGISEALIDVSTDSAIIVDEGVNLYGNVLFSVDLDLTKRGFFWGDSPENTDQNIEHSTNGWGQFIDTIQQVPSPGIYYYRAWGMVGPKLYQAPVRSFVVCSSDTTHEYADVCKGESYTFPDGSTWDNITSDGAYISSLTAQNGCDSLVMTSISVSVVDTSVIVDGIKLTAGAVNAVYQWLDCDNNYEMISGATEQSFTATQNGNYAVIVSENNCTDTSLCYAVTTVGIKAQGFKDSFEIFPNPVKEHLNIKIGDEGFSGQLEIWSVLGKVVYSLEVKNTHIVDIPMYGFRSGVYFLKMHGEKETAVFRILKE